MIGKGLQGYLLDTCIASAAWDMGNKSYPQMRSYLSNFERDFIFISCITIAEIEYGLKTASKMDQSRQKIVREEMSAYDVRNIDKHTARYYSDIRAHLFNKYAPHQNKNKRTKYIEDLSEETTCKTLGIQENDVWIVSVAKQYNLIFITSDIAGGMKKVVEAADYAQKTVFWSSKYNG